MTMDSTTAISVKPGWLGLPAAAGAFFHHLHLFTAPQPSTPLRVLSLMAITAALRSRGMLLNAECRSALIHAMEVGALLNDRFDGDKHHFSDIRKHVASFSRSIDRDCICQYIKRLRRLERSRPAPGCANSQVKTYRENVNRISLAALWAIAVRKPVDQAECEIQHDSDLRVLFRIVMLAQLIDDMMDIRKDRARGLASFATAADAGQSSLRETACCYGNPAPLRWDENFCLHLILRLTTHCAKTAINFRRALRLIPE